MRAPEYNVTPLPATWPGKATPEYQRIRSPFKQQWTRTMDLLDREVFHLEGKNVEIACDVRPNEINLSGQLRANARPRSPGVVLSFDVGPDRLIFPCDTYRYWQDNVYAIALTLEKLRAIDRYGVQQGKQYHGFKAIPASTSATISVERAAQIVGERASRAPSRIVGDRDVAREAIRIALNATHPDRNGSNGSAEPFQLVQSAKSVLEAHHGGRL